MMYLLDINVLLAFAYDEQVSHQRVARWIRHIESTETEGPRFATCSIVDLGFIRIASGGAGLAESLTEARADLRWIKRALDLRLLGDELDGNQLPDWVSKSKPDHGRPSPGTGDFAPRTVCDGSTPGLQALS